jgi:hypothetical protein
MRRLPTFAPWMMSVWLHGCLVLLGWFLGDLRLTEAAPGEGGRDDAGEGEPAGEVGSATEITPLETLQQALDAALALNAEALAALNGQLDPVSISIYEEVSTLEPGDEAETPPETPPKNTTESKIPPKPTSSSTVQNNGSGESAGNNSSTSPGNSNGTGEGNAKGPKKPCVPVEGITQTGPAAWSVQKKLVEYYATHLNALDHLGAIRTHTSPENKPDGLWIGLSRCSALKQGGIKHNDIVRKINGMQVNSVTDAVTAWFRFRDKGNIKVELTRGSQTVNLTYKIIK